MRRLRITPHGLDAVEVTVESRGPQGGACALRIGGPGLTGQGPPTAGDRPPTTDHGIALDARLEEAAPGMGWLEIAGRVPVRWLRIGSNLELWLDGRVYRFRIEDAPSSSIRRDLLPPPGGEILSPMPGVIREVFVLPGQTVALGEALLRMESMKMQLTVPALAAASVDEVRCAPGDQVEKGQILLRLSPPAAQP